MDKWFPTIPSIVIYQSQTQNLNHTLYSQKAHLTLEDELQSVYCISVEYWSSYTRSTLHLLTIVFFSHLFYINNLPVGPTKMFEFG